jgi:hypothetical protein
VRELGQALDNIPIGKGDTAAVPHQAAAVGRFAAGVDRIA